MKRALDSSIKEDKIDYISSLPIDIWRTVIDYLWHMIVCYMGSHGLYNLQCHDGCEMLFYRKKPFATLSISSFLRNKLFYGAGLVRFALMDMIYLRKVEVIKWTFINRVILPPSYFFRPLNKETRAIFKNKKFYQTFAKASTLGMKTLYEALDRHRTMMKIVNPENDYFLKREWIEACSCLYCKEELYHHCLETDEYEFDEYNSSDDDDRASFMFRKGSYY